MSSIKDQDYDHANDRSNAPEERMNCCDQADNMHINHSETREKHLEKIKQPENISSSNDNSKSLLSWLRKNVNRKYTLMDESLTRYIQNSH